MDWRLGLDLGTNSMGWSVLGLDYNDRVDAVIDMGVRIFHDSRDQKTGEPLAVERRMARGTRKNLRRRKQRRRGLFQLLQKENLFPAEKAEAVKLKIRDPYALRIKALDQKLERYELGRALFHLGVRRGFKSNRKDNADEALPVENENELKDAGRDISKMKQGEKCLVLKEAIEKSELRTIGEFLFHHNKIDNETKKNTGLRFAPGRFPWYPLRELYEKEFDLIRGRQEKYYTEVAWDEIKNAIFYRRHIFYQRPLKKQERGKCPYIPENDRSFKTMPSAIRARILQDVYNLSFYDDRQMPKELSGEQRKALIELLDKSKKDVMFEAIKKKLKIDCHHFNLESDIRTSLKGNPTGNILRGVKYFGALWDRLSLGEQDNIVEMLIEEDEEIAVKKALEKYSLTDEQKEMIARFVPDRGTTSFCKEFTQRLVETMEKENCGYVKAMETMGIKHSEENVDKFDELPYYGKVLAGSTIGGDAVKFTEKEPEKKYGKISNPTVHVALNQTRTVINALIGKYGKPKQVVIELSRELKASRADKDRNLKKQAENIRRNEIHNKSIMEIMPAIKYPNRADRLKYRLWEELGATTLSRCCLYCGNPINCSELFTDAIEVEHILPFSRTLLDGSSNLTVAHARCNAFKGNKSPYEAFSSNPAGYNWDEISARVKALHYSLRDKKSRFTADAMERFENEAAFISRQLTDNAYLSKMARKYVKSICDDVWCVSGGITKILRDKWDIDRFLKRKIGEKEIVHFSLSYKKIGLYKKNRYDHRHHALDALIIGLTDRGMVNQIARLSGLAKGDKIKPPDFPFSREEIINRLRNIVISFKPEHGSQGKLSKETALGKIKIDGKDCYVNRIPIASLKEKNIKTIIDPVIKKLLLEFRENRKDEKFENILVQFSKETGIKRLRCKTFAQTPIEIKPNKKNPLTRYYNPTDYLCAIVWRLPVKTSEKTPKYEAQYVRRTEVDKNGKPIEVKHPAAKRICVLYKQDYIEFTENGETKIARIAGYDERKKRIDIRPIFATKYALDWIIATSEQMLEHGWKPQKEHYYVYVNTLFGKCAARKITVSPIGDVRRK